MITRTKKNVVPLSKASVGGGVIELSNNLLNLNSFTNGPYVPIESYIYLVNNVTDLGQYTIDISPYLPKDDFYYEIYLTVYMQITRPNSRRNIGLGISGIKMPTNMYSPYAGMICISDGSSEASTYNGTVLVDNRKKIFISMNSTEEQETLNDLQVKLVGYKRMSLKQ